MADYTGSFSGSFEGTFLGGVVSSSAQLSINWNSDIIVNKPTTISPFQANSIIANNRFRESTFPAHSASVSTRFTNINSEIGVLDDRITAAVSGTVPPGTISGSAQIAAFGYLTSASAAALGFGSGGGASIPAGTVSSSTQITNVITDAYISASAAASGFGSGGGEIYTAGLGILVSGNVISLNTSSQHFIQGVSASAAASGFGGGGGSNAAPTIEDQTLTAVPESSSGGYEVGLITATDAEGNVITFGSFTIANIFLSTNPSVNLTSSLGGTSLFDPSTNPFQVNSTGTVTRKNGQFLNADIADRYVYLATATDPFATATGSGLVTIPISQHTSSSIGVNGGTYYIIESAVEGVNLTTQPNGYSSGDVTFSSAVSQMWEVNTNPSGYVRFTNGNTYQTGSSVILEVDTDISGNLSFGQTVDIQITASQTSFETTKQYRNHTLNITENKPYLVAFSNTSDNLNTNGARPSNTLTTISFTEQQSGVGDTLNHSSFIFTDPSGDLTASRSGDEYLVSALTNLSSSISYNFTASIRDNHGKIGTGSHSITIVQAPTGSLAPNAANFYVIESAVSGNLIYTNSNGRTGTQADLNVTYSPQLNGAAVASFTSSNAMVHVKSNGNLSVAQDVSGSAFTFAAGTPITSNITWKDQYNNVGGPAQISINVAINNAPTVNVDSPSTNNHNTNLGVAGAQLATLTWGDIESDTLNVGSFSLSGAGASLLSSSYNGSNIFKITALNDLNAGTINYTASIKDIHGFRTGTYNDFFVIAQAGGGTISPSTFFIIESAESGSPITLDTDGLGSAATLSVGYSPNYGTQTAEQFRTLDSIVSVTSNGVLSVKDDISGSANQSGDNINATIFWLDQYGNEGTGSITIEITDNQNPTAVFTDQSLTAPVSSVGTNLVSVSLTDPEGLTPFSMSLSGLSANSMSAVPQNVASSSYQLQNSVAIGTGCILFYTASVFDSYNQETQYKRSLTITSASVASPLWYLYTSEAGGTAEDNELATFLAVYGDANDDGITDSGYPFDNLTSGDIGQTSFTSSVYTAFGVDNNTLVASGSILSGSDTTPFISNLNHVNLGFMIVFPSSSEVGITPSSMTNALGGSTTNQYVLFSDRPGTSGIDDNPQTSYVKYFNLDSGTYPNSSATRFGVIFVGGGSSNITYFLMASSGSAPTSTQ
jgi:hypothetical protein